MSEENVERSKAAYEAYAAGDIDKAFENADDGLVWHGPSEMLPTGGTYEGVDAIKSDWLREVGETFEEFAVNAEEFIDAGDYVVVRGTARSKPKGKDAIEGPFLHLWKMRDGKSVEAWFFGDSARLYAALND
jgi:ketosteroid isomerase-like protein